MKRNKQYKKINQYETLNKKQIKYIKNYFLNYYEQEFKELMPEYKNHKIEVHLYDVEEYDIDFEHSEKDWCWYVEFETEDFEWFRVADVFIKHNDRRTLKQILNEHVTQIYY